MLHAVRTEDDFCWFPFDSFSMRLLRLWCSQSVRSLLKLRENVWDKFLRLPIGYFDQTKSGESVSRVVNDTAIIKDLITRHFPQLISGIVSVIGAVVILFILDWRMSLIMFIAVPISIVR